MSHLFWVATSLVLLHSATLGAMSVQADEHETDVHQHEAQDADVEAPVDTMAEVEITAQPVAEGVYMLTGRGGNMGLFTDDDVTFLIDDQFAPLSDRIVAQIANVTPRPVDYLVNTHWHFDHTGGNEAFGKAGAVIIAHDNVRIRMARGARVEAFNLDIAPAPEVALPSMTYDGSFTLHLGRQTIHGRHMPNAHTDGDTVLLIQPANVLHTGDTFFHLLYPFIDLESGGSINGLIKAVAVQIEMIDDAAKIIPGHGPMADRQDLQTYHDMLETVRDRVAIMIENGDMLEAVLAAKVTEAFDDTSNRFGFLTPDQFVTSVYRSLVIDRNKPALQTEVDSLR